MNTESEKRYGLAAIGILKASLGGTDRKWKDCALTLISIQGEWLAELQAQVKALQSDKKPD